MVLLLQVLLTLQEECHQYWVILLQALLLQAILKPPKLLRLLQLQPIRPALRVELILEV